MERFKLSKWSIAAVLVLTAGVLLSCSFMADLVSSEPEVFWPMRSDDGYGLMNCSGEWVVEPMDRRYEPDLMVDGLAPVYDREAADYPVVIMNVDGEFIVEYEFIRAWPYSEGYALVETEDGFRFIDQIGEFVFSEIFPPVMIEPQFGNGLANVAVEVIGSGSYSYPESMIYIDTNGDGVLGPYTIARPFTDGYAAVILGEGEDYKTGFIDTNGDFVLEFNRESMLSPAGLYSEGLFPVRDFDSEDDCNIGFMNKEGKWEIEPQFCAVGRFVDGLAPAAKEFDINYQFGYINKNGDWVIEPQYEMVTANEFNGGCTLVYWDWFSSSALIDTEGDIIYSYEP